MGLLKRGNMQTAALKMAAAIGVLAALFGPALADDVKPPSDPVARAAFDVLEKHCSRCHQEGRLTARERPAKNFGNVLKLDELAETPSLVRPGNPFASKLFKQIVDKEMPYDVMYEGADKPAPSEADIKAIAAWINALGTANKVASAAPIVAAGAAPATPAAASEVAASQSAPAAAATKQLAPAGPAASEAPVATAAAGCAGHTFVSHQDMVGLMAADLDKLPKSRARGTRYLTLTHFTNICTKDKLLEVYRQGAVKLINSLSRSPDVVRLETIDPDASILRINIDDLGWDAADWDEVIASYPYNTQPDTQLNGVLNAATGTRLPYVRADWFAFAAARPGLYEKILKLPRTFQALAKDQGVDVEANIRKFIARRVGFQKSGVSENNRLIERHPSRSGYFWTSYDFSGNRGRQSLFEHPLGPGGPNGFQHNGGETIFGLPNGFQAYYLNNAKGEPLSRGPTNIVHDLGRKDLTVTNGISCMGCHDQGMRKAKDDVRASVLSGRSFSKDVREAVEALYPPTERMDQIIAADGKRFTDAMARAGLDPTLKLNGVEMINALSDRYEADLDFEQAAAEFGLTKEALAKAADDVEKRFKPLVRRLEQDVVPRDQFETAFRELAADVSDEQIVRVVGAKSAVARPARSEADVDLSLTSDRDGYKRGDSPVFTIVSARECFLTLTDVDEKGEGTVLFPNKFEQKNVIKANVPVQFPSAGAPYQYRMKDRGVETVVAVCSERDNSVDGIRHDFNRAAFTSVTDYTRSIARSIVVEAKAPGGAPKPVKSAAAARELSRAAIKIDVR
jgi:hypothetical protein